MMELHTALSVEPAGVLQPPAASLNVPGPANVASDISGNGPLVQPLAASNGGAGVPPLNPAAVAGMSTAPGDGGLPLFPQLNESALTLPPLLFPQYQNGRNLIANASPLDQNGRCPGTNVVYTKLSPVLAYSG